MNQTVCKFPPESGSKEICCKADNVMVGLFDQEGNQSRLPLAFQSLPVCASADASAHIPADEDVDPSRATQLKVDVTSEDVSGPLERLSESDILRLMERARTDSLKVSLSELKEKWEISLPVVSVSCLALSAATHGIAGSTVVVEAEPRSGRGNSTMNFVQRIKDAVTGLQISSATVTCAAASVRSGRLVRWPDGIV